MANLEEHIIKLRDQFSGPLNKISDNTDNFRSKIAGVGTAIAGAFAAMQISQFAIESVRAWDENEKAIAQVKTAIQSTGGAAGRTLEQLTATADKFQKNTLFGDEQILQGVTAQLLTFTNIATTEFDRAQIAAMNLAARMGGDLQGASIMVGKALNDPINAISALSRKGVQFSDAQKDVIKNLAETNRLAEAQTIILNELEKQFGGSAEAAARAGLGPLQVFQNQLGELKESIGGVIAEMALKLTPTLFAIIDRLNAFGDWFTANLTTIKIVAGAIGGIAAAVAALYVPTLLVTGATALFSGALAVLNFIMMANPISVVIVALAALAGAFAVAYNSSAKFRATILGLWAVLKTVGGNIVSTFTKLPSLIIDAFKAIPTAIAASFQNIGQLITAVLSGDFKAVPKILKDLLGNAIKANPLTAVGKNVFDSLGADAGTAFSDAYDKEIETSAKAAEKKKGGAPGLVTPGGLPAIPVPGGKPASAASASASGAGGSGKNITLNINKLVETLEIHTTNLTESASAVREAVTRALLAAVNDSQIVETSAGG